MTTLWRVLVATSAVAAACFATTASAQDPAPQPQPAPEALVHFRPANVPWPLSKARARRAARAEAVRAWGAREPRVVSARRVTFSKVDCRVRWRGKAGGTYARTVKVKRTSTYGVQAFAAPIS